MQFIDRRSLRSLRASITTLGGSRVSMAHQGLHRRYIHAGVKEIPGKRAAHIVRRERFYAGLLCTLGQDEIDSLAYQPVQRHVVAS
jgi:hypothetical protein